MSESPSFFGRLRDRLSRSASKLTGDFASLFRGRKIDAGLLDELEARLIGADVGVTATQEILEQLRAGVARRELDDADALMAALRRQLLAILAPCAKPLAQCLSGASSAKLASAGRRTLMHAGRWTVASSTSRFSSL